MYDKNNRPIRRVFISACRAELDGDSNWHRTNKLVQLIADAGFTAARTNGYYKGVREASFMVLAPHDNVLNTVVNWAREFEQESVLIVDEYQQGALLYMDPTNRPQQIGTWSYIESGDETEYEAYTEFADGSRYVCK